MMRNKIYTLLLSAMVLTVAATALLNADEAARPAATDRFETAVEIIKKYETLHQPRHYPLVGYGHLVMRGEKYSRTKAMNPDDAEALLRKDLLKNCAIFRKYGADSLLLGTLAYNVGMGTVLRSSIIRKLDRGDRDIRDIYISYNKYRGRPHQGIRNRRIEEFNSLYIREPRKQDLPADSIIALPPADTATNEKS